MYGQNKYETARVLAHQSREQASEKTYISVSTIKRIERGTQRCNPDQAKALADAYDAPWVADPKVPDDYRPITRERAMLRFINEREDVEAKIPRLRRILADGKVDEHEAQEFEDIQREIKEEGEAARDLQYAV